MKRIALPAVLSLLAGMPAVFAQFTAPIGSITDFSNIANQVIFAFILFYGLIMILIGWVYKHTKDRPVEQVPFQPKTLAILGGICGVLVALTPTGLVPPELSTPFFMLVGASLLIMFLGVATDIEVFRSKEKESPEEAAFDIVAGAGLRATRQEARITAKEEKMEIEEQDTLKKIVKFLHDRPRTRQFLEAVFDEHQDVLRQKFGRDVILVNEIHNLYSEARSSLGREKALTELEAAEILIKKGEALIAAQETGTTPEQKKERQQLKTELTYMNKALNKITQQVQKEKEGQKQRKEQEAHVLEYLISYVRVSIIRVARDINSLKANPRQDSDYKTELQSKETLRAELTEFENLLKKLVNEIVSEAHYLAQEEELVNKMKRINKQVYKRELGKEEAAEMRAESKLNIEGSK